MRRANTSFWTAANRRRSASRRYSVPASACVNRRASVRIRAGNKARSRSLVKAIPIWMSCFSRRERSRVKGIYSVLSSAGLRCGGGYTWRGSARLRLTREPHGPPRHDDASEHHACAQQEIAEIGERRARTLRAWPFQLLPDPKELPPRLAGDDEIATRHVFGIVGATTTK